MCPHLLYYLLSPLWDTCHLDSDLCDMYAFHLMYNQFFFLETNFNDLTLVLREINSTNQWKCSYLVLTILLQEWVKLVMSHLFKSLTICLKTKCFRQTTYSCNMLPYSVVTVPQYLVMPVWSVKFLNHMLRLVGHTNEHLPPHWGAVMSHYSIHNYTGAISINETVCLSSLVDTCH